ncbi:hypothetical protein DVH05_017023 [Phytophthora capsici]|nr:hypothetical protein DVH05_017023 [Phytophthora capsici]
MIHHKREAVFDVVLSRMNGVASIRKLTSLAFELSPGRRRELPDLLEQLKVIQRGPFSADEVEECINLAREHAVGENLLLSKTEEAPVSTVDQAVRSKQLGTSTRSTGSSPMPQLHGSDDRSTCKTGHACKG